jgi:hypothetical protein
MKAIKIYTRKKIDITMNCNLCSFYVTYKTENPMNIPTHVGRINQLEIRQQTDTQKLLAE